MTPATATQDEDLLIISEDSASDVSDIDFSFSFGDDTPASTPAASVEASQAVTAPATDIFSELSSSLDSTPPAVESVASSDPIADTLETPVENIAQIETPFISQEEMVVAPVIEETSSVEPTAGLNISALLHKKEVANEAMMEEVSQETTTPVNEMQVADEVVSAPETSEIAQIQAEEVSSTQNQESLNDILSATITKLALRAEVISQDSSGKSAQIASIKEQIKLLEEQVSGLEADISVLHSEADKISKNIQALEEMKLDPVKEHNARRVAKK